jgi:hypothetical protein
MRYSRPKGSNSQAATRQAICRAVHAAPWQLRLPATVAGDMIRALAWLGPSSRTEEAIATLSSRLAVADLQQAASVIQKLPDWLFQLLNRWGNV